MKNKKSLYGRRGELKNENMKNSKKLFSITLLLVLMAGTPMLSFSQDSKKSRDSAQTALITGMINDQRFVFNAQSASPTKGGLVQLTPGYTLRVTKDTVVSDLPYYGRAYQAGYGSSESGIKFTSVDFSCNTEAGKKKSWKITIQPKDNKSFRELMLTVYDDGSATLNVNSNDRQAISFRGYLSEPKR
jgi:Domain of unknown function (DUF4251)